jgi:hypothetical protein
MRYEKSKVIQHNGVSVHSSYYQFVGRACASLQCRIPVQANGTSPCKCLQARHSADCLPHGHKWYERKSGLDAGLIKPGHHLCS